MTIRTQLRLRQKLATTALFVGVAALSTDALAVCDQTGMTAADADWWAATGGYWADFVMWHYKAYHVHASDWGDRGFFAANDPRFEYAKHWAAARLLASDIPSTPRPGFWIPPFHDGGLDYQELGRGRESDEWHDDFRSLATDDTSIYGSFEQRYFMENLVSTSCMLYSHSLSPDGLPSAATPSRRISDFVHEGWHAWKENHGISHDHERRSPTGKCPGTSCDTFYPHAKSAFVPGQLWASNYYDHSRYHSVYQVQMEAFCDIADSSSGRLPNSVRIAAGLEGNAIVERFVNGAPIRCSTPTPRGVVMVGSVPVCPLGDPTCDPTCEPPGESCGSSADCCSGCCKAGACVHGGECIK